MVENIHTTKDIPVRNNVKHLSWFCDFLEISERLSDKIPTYDKEVWDVVFTLLLKVLD